MHCFYCCKATQYSVGPPLAAATAARREGMDPITTDEEYRFFVNSFLLQRNNIFSPPIYSSDKCVIRLRSSCLLWESASSSRSAILMRFFRPNFFLAWDFSSPSSNFSITMEPDLFWILCVSGMNFKNPRGKPLNNFVETKKDLNGTQVFSRIEIWTGSCPLIVSQKVDVLFFEQCLSRKSFHHRCLVMQIKIYGRFVTNCKTVNGRFVTNRKTVIMTNPIILSLVNKYFAGVIKWKNKRWKRCDGDCLVSGHPVGRGGLPSFWTPCR